MIGVRKSIYTLFTLSILLGLCGALLACLDIPSEPSSTGKATSVSVRLVQNSDTSTANFKINVQDSATFIAEVKPGDYTDNLSFAWYHNDDLLASGATYKDKFIYPEDTPNRIIVIDNERNFLEKYFDFTLNTPPRIGATFFPKDSSVYTVTVNQPIEFKWYIYDADADTIISYLTIDKNVYNVGTLTTLSQSGFEPGWHSVSIEVIDEKKVKATSSTHHFKVLAPEEE